MPATITSIRTRCIATRTVVTYLSEGSSMERPRLAQAYVILARLVLGGMFVVSGLEKAWEPAHFALVVRQYQLLPLAWVPPFSILFPWLEVAIGLCLLIGLYVRLASAATLALLVGFIGGFILRFGEEFALGCGCFPPGQHEPEIIGWSLIVRNLALSALALAPLLWGPGPLSVDRSAPPRRGQQDAPPPS